MTRVLSALSGILIAVMIAVNGTLAIYAGNIGAIVLIHLSGLVVAVLFLVISRKPFHPKTKLPLFLYSAGAMGVLAVMLNNWTFARLGVTLTLTLGLLGQSLASLIIDHYGWFGTKKVRFQPKKLIGLSLFLIGIFVMNYLPI